MTRVCSTCSRRASVLWSHNLTDFHSVMGAITADGHVLLAGGPLPGSTQRGSFLHKLDPATGHALWSAPFAESTAAAVALDASGSAWVQTNNGLAMVTAQGNTTWCPDTGKQSLGSVAIPADGLLLVPEVYGGLRAFV